MTIVAASSINRDPVHSSITERLYALRRQQKVRDDRRAANTVRNCYVQFIRCCKYDNTVHVIENAKAMCSEGFKWVRLIKALYEVTDWMKAKGIIAKFRNELDLVQQTVLDICGNETACGLGGTFVSCAILLQSFAEEVGYTDAKPEHLHPINYVRQYGPCGKLHHSCRYYDLDDGMLFY